jgi:intracellular septation protein A
MFSLNRKSFSFDLDGVSYTFELRIEEDDCIYEINREGASIHEERRALVLSEFFAPFELEAQTPEGYLRFVVGPVSPVSLALEVYHEDILHWRSSKKPFKIPERTRGFLNWLEHQSETCDAPATPEQRKGEEEAKQLRPAIIVDIVFGAVFFFVAREYGLVTAALTGALATLVLVIVDRLVKPDLTGGFAVFGAAIALISAGLAVSLQDELLVKLRGSIMGVVVAGFAFLDWLNSGRYLGIRFARYFYALGTINPRRASLALCLSGLLIVVIETVLALRLSTDQWIWYNAFLDSLVTISILFGAMWLAREKRDMSDSEGRESPHQIES